jgi:hypothetical protein
MNAGLPFDLIETEKRLGHLKRTHSYRVNVPSAHQQFGEVRRLW